MISVILNDALARIEARAPLVLSGLRGGGKAWLIAELAARTERPLVVLTESFHRAEALYHDLGCFAGAERVFHFPNWDTIPYDSFSPNKEIVAQRFGALAALLEGRCPILVVTPQAMMQAMMPVSVFQEVAFDLRTGRRYPRRGLVENLVQAGYVRVDLVEAPGEFSARGEIVDVFPINAGHPVRMDFFDDDLESMRQFEVDTQKSFQDTDYVTVFPASESVLNSATTARALAKLPNFKSRMQPEAYRQIYGYLEQGTPFPGAEQMLGLFYESPGWLHEALPRDAVLLMDEPELLAKRSRDFFGEVLSEYELTLEQGNMALPPDEGFLTPEAYATALEGFYKPELVELSLEDGPRTLLCPFADNQSLRSAATADGQGAHATLGKLVEQIKAWRDAGAVVYLASRSPTGAERLRNLLGEFELGARIAPAQNGPFQFALVEEAPTTVADITVLEQSPRSGFRVADGEGATRFVLITEEELLGEKIRQRRLKKSNLQHFIASLGDLKEGDLVVHIDYGIGRYEGLRTMQAGQETGDFLVLCYAGDDKVYVPVHRLNQVQKYTGVDGAAPALNRLGDGLWQRSKQKASRIIEDMAEDLVRVQAARKARVGFSFEENESMMTEFAEAFPFQETEDQQQAIDEVLEDMVSEMPMDRLVCGDVGFGKTEVAMRAAFLAVLNGKQALMLVPTTILAQQHYETFQQRFAEFPVMIDVLSRFRTAQQQKAVVEAFAMGELDILIGTHRLLSKDIRQKDLGLLVIDEEQRFGVAHKEKLKQIRTQVDVVTLSATPIPRTLHMALMGVRDLSIINTPPMDRMAVRTRLTKASDYMIREAVERETRRGGQVFFVHNRVETIHAFGTYLQGIMPGVRMAIAHGQMAEKQLEAVMLSFVSGELEVLLTTTIIESGLDIPRANTIIISNADQFGLSQLYQLRGRVGRSNVQAYAYLMVSPEKLLTDVAQKRLTLLQEFNDLGSGFKIASHDLEIRGAGNLLGQEQSGHINSVGLELYTHMVEEAVDKLRGEDALRPRAVECRLELGYSYRLPDTYIASTPQRLDAYKRLAELESEAQMWEYREALEDRFGRMPEEVGNLFTLIQVRLKAAAYGVSLLEQVGGQLQAQFTEPERIDLERLMVLLQEPERQLQLVPGDKLLLGPMPKYPGELLERLRIMDEVVKPPRAPGELPIAELGTAGAETNAQADSA
ncbi:MAG: transcription-repair coupling factor [SAR324 cluster bacterium]|nr:transcription-repair coupling factor [SAR324 cluster bacterium]